MPQGQGRTRLSHSPRDSAVRRPHPGPGLQGKRVLGLDDHVDLVDPGQEVWVGPVDLGGLDLDALAAEPAQPVGQTARAADARPAELAGEDRSGLQDRLRHRQAPQVDDFEVGRVLVAEVHAGGPAAAIDASQDRPVEHDVSRGGQYDSGLGDRDDVCGAGRALQEQFACGVAAVAPAHARVDPLAILDEWVEVQRALRTSAEPLGVDLVQRGESTVGAGLDGHLAGTVPAAGGGPHQPRTQGDGPGPDVRTEGRPLVAAQTRVEGPTAGSYHCPPPLTALVRPPPGPGRAVLAEATVTATRSRAAGSRTSAPAEPPG